MITFLRKVRHRLVSDNKVSKYILYALGEIILVVIGILIALQINNWNEVRKVRTEEGEILKQIYNDLDFETIEFEHEIKSVQKRIDYLTAVSERNYGKVNLDSSLLYVAWCYYLNRHNKSYLSLKETGNTSIISNKELLEEIILYYENNYQNLEAYSDWHVIFTTNTIEDYIVKNLPVEIGFLTEGDKIKELMESSNFRSLVNYQISALSDIIEIIDSAKIESKKLSLLINENIN